MKKKINLGFIFLLFMFFFITKVHAIDVKGFTCKYPATGLEYLGIEYFAFIQDTNGKMGIFVSKDNINYTNSNYSIFIENFSSKLYTSPQPYYYDCPSLSMTSNDNGNEIAIYLFDEEGEHPCSNDNECTYEPLIQRNDFRELDFDGFSFPGNLEIFDERDGNSYFVEGVEEIERVPMQPSEQEPTIEPHPPRLDYSSICSSNKGVKSAAKIVGYVLSIGKWVVAFIIIIFGVVDFSQAVISSDEKAINKAASKLLKRFIAGVIAIVIPTLPIVLLNIIQVSQGIEKSSNFAACTKCIFDPFNSCD